MWSLSTTYCPVMWSLSQVLPVLWMFPLYKAWSLENITAPWGNSGIDRGMGVRKELIQHSALIWPPPPNTLLPTPLPFYLITISLSPPSCIIVLPLTRLSVWEHERNSHFEVVCEGGRGWFRHRNKKRSAFWKDIAENQWILKVKVPCLPIYYLLIWYSQPCQHLPKEKLVYHLCAFIRACMCAIRYITTSMSLLL